MKDVPQKRVIAIPNLLDAHWSGFGPTGDQPDVGLVHQEVLHAIAGPLVETNLNVIDEEQASAFYADLRKQVPPSYGGWEIILGEQVVRALF